jgi:hypothetical protein
MSEYEKEHLQKSKYFNQLRLFNAYMKHIFNNIEEDNGSYHYQVWHFNQDKFKLFNL